MKTDIPWSKEQLFKANDKLMKENKRLKFVISDIEKGYRGSEVDLEEKLDKYFYGGTSPIRKGSKESN